MAWTRTAISLAVVSMLWLRWSHVYGEIVLIMVALMISAALLIHLSQKRRYRKAARGLAASQVRADVRGVLLMAASIIAFGLGGLLLILVN